MTVSEATANGATPAEAVRSEVLGAFLDGCQPVTGRALQYLTGRKIAAAVVDAFGTRFCDREYPELHSRLVEAFGAEAVADAGLVSQPKPPRKPAPIFWHYYAKGIGFLLFPFYMAGRVVQLCARPPIDKAEAERLKVIRMMFTRASIPVNSRFWVICIRVPQRVRFNRVSISPISISPLTIPPTYRPTSPSTSTSTASVS
jgi:hypothetical protein